LLCSTRASATSGLPSGPVNPAEGTREVEETEEEEEERGEEEEDESLLLWTWNCSSSTRSSENSVEVLAMDDISERLGIL
jgi:hypothetical protein